VNSPENKHFPHDFLVKKIHQEGEFLTPMPDISAKIV
jgi:hypothetical protein